jgi:hypothetical protein
LPLAPAELIGNIDGCPFRDWEERKATPVLIPSRVRDATLHYPVDRRIRHQTLVCCVTAAGNAYCPLFASGDRSVTQILDTGVGDGIDLTIQSASSPYVTQNIFKKHIDTVFIPAVISNLDLLGRKDKPAISFCDNCSAHCSNAVLDKIARNGILVIANPPHTSHIFQALDILLSRILKRAKR